MEREPSKVYALTDERGRVLRVEGGYSLENIKDISEWIYIDEGFGDRYNLCQSNYLPKELSEEHGIPVYKYENGEITERTAEEIQADIEALPPPPPSYGELAAENEDARNALRIAGITADDE